MVPSASTISLIIVSLVETVLGIFANGFIVVVNIQDWRIARRLTSVDIMLVTLGIFNILMQSALVVNSTIGLIWQETLILKSIIPVLFLVIVSLVYSNFWLSACLCVFYCLKIANINHPLFMQLQLRFSKIVPWVILVALMTSVSVSIPIIINNLNTSSNSTSNHTMTVTFKWMLCGTSFGCFLPLLIVVLSVVLILLSLYRHTQKMKMGMSDHNKLRTDAQVRTAAFMIGLLVLYSSFFAIEFSSLFQDTTFITVVTCTVTNAFPSAQSVLLILGNSKLRMALWRLWGRSSAGETD